MNAKFYNVNDGEVKGYYNINNLMIGDTTINIKYEGLDKEFLKDNKLVFEAPFLPDDQITTILNQSDNIEYTYNHTHSHLKLWPKKK